MQVRKFEARTMREALEMVKTQLGPDAIILSARDIGKAFGLVGQSSVEVTAAISDETLHKKRFTESRLREQDREKFLKSPARVQRQVIDKMVNNYIDQNAPKPGITKTPYIEIGNEELAAETRATADVRIRDAAQRAWSAMQAHSAEAAKAIAKTAPAPVADLKEVDVLRTELAKLKETLSHFQKIPQNIVGVHPGSDFGLPYEFSAIFEKLTSAGMAPDIVAEILTLAHKQMPPIKFKNKALVEGWVAKYILDKTKVVSGKTDSQLQIFVGPPGSGKTSTLVKMASHYVVNENKKVAIVTVDVNKVGAVDQLRIYSQILNVPFAVVRSAQDWDYIIKQLHHFDYILCDGPGVGLKSLEEISKLKAMLPPATIPHTTHLVLSATAKDSDLQEVGKRYGVVRYKDVIFTAIDESVQHGNIYNFMKRFDVPLHSFGIGQKVPEDFEIATRERVLDLIFKLTKVKKG